MNDKAGEQSMTFKIEPQWECPECGRWNSLAADTCALCGLASPLAPESTAFSDDPKDCKRCGGPLAGDNDSNLCYRCKREVQDGEDPVETVRRKVAEGDAEDRRAMATAVSIESAALEEFLDAE